jgi:LacI family transcriptional regulator
LRTPLVGIRIGSNNATGRDMYRGIFRYMRTHVRWRLAIDPTNRPEATILPQCDAYIAGLWTDEIREWAARLNKPLINVSSRRDLPGTPQVCVNDVEIGRMAGTYLAERTLRQFGFVGRIGEPQVQGRLQGFEEALAERGLRCDVFPWRENAGRLDWSGLLDWLKRLPKPSGVFCNNDDTGRLVTQAGWESGIVVPEQLAVLGADNDEVFCESSDPPLSSIDTGTARVGEEAARCLHLLLQGHNRVADQKIEPIRVQERASSDLVAIDDPDLAVAIRYIRENACEGITVEDVVRSCGLNRRHLERSFKARLGRPPLDQILRVRLARARDLLLNTSLPMKQVAQKSGFRYLQTFYRAYSASFGESPGAVRKARIADQLSP